MVLINFANILSIKPSSSKATLSIPTEYIKYFTHGEFKQSIINNIHISMINHASISCPGPNHPLILAKRSGCIGWIHFIKVNQDPNIANAKLSSNEWYFVDTSEKADPFYTKGEIFFDNPLWTQPSTRNLSWQGMVFPIIEKHGNMHVTNGFSWGFVWNSFNNIPTALQLDEIKTDLFFELATLFKDDFDFLNIIQK